MQDTLNAIILNAVQRALQDSCTAVCNPLPTTSPTVYINYALCKWERRLGHSTDTYSIGPYPHTIARYLVDYYLPTLHTGSKDSYTYTKRVTISLRPRRYSNVIAGPPVEDIEALILSKVEEDLSEHILTYLSLQDFLRRDPTLSTTCLSHTDNGSP